jgi:glycosyltransferase involved in cell wall biosynthesis
MEKTEIPAKSKKRILIVIPQFPRLTQTFIERDVSTLADFEDTEITVFSLERGKGYLSPNLENIVVYGRINSQDALKAFFTQLVAKMPITLNLIKLAFRKDKYDRAPIHKKLILLLKGAVYAQKFGYYLPQEIHAHFLSEMSTICMSAATYLGIPFSLNVHAKDVLVNPSMPIIKLRKAKFTAVCNRYAYNKLIEMAKGNTEKINLIYHGLDEKRLEVDNLFLVKSTRPLIFLLVSRLVEKKGVDYMIEASHILLGRGIDHEVAIIGANDPSVPINMYEKYKAQIKELQMEDVVKIIGEGKGVPFEEAKQYYKVADIFVMPSIAAGSGDADGVPNTVIEAALSKLPIVATDAGSIKDLLNDQNAMLVAQKSAVQIADAIERLLMDPNLRENLGKRAYFDAKEMFSSARNVNILHKLLLK